MPRPVRAAGLLALAMFAATAPVHASSFSPATLDAQIQQCMADINADSLLSYLQTLQGFTTRHTSSDTTSATTGIGAARRWMHGKFLEFAANGGNLTASYHDFNSTISGVNRLHRNVVGEIPGTETGPQKRIYLIGGHLDSRNEDVDDIVGAAFGTDDDASGIACTLELARVLSLQSWPMTFRFLGFVGEEQGLVGSGFYARDTRDLGEPLAAMIANDVMASIIGAPDPDSTVTTDTTLARAFARGPEDSPARQLQRYLKAMGDVYVPIQNIVLIPAADRPGRGSDHLSFSDEGFTAIRYMEYLEELFRQHSADGDTLGTHLDMEYMRRNAQVDLATLANLALAPDSPGGLAAADIGDSTGFRLIWPSTNSEPDFAGYLVTTRLPGQLDYDQTFDVGNVNEFTFASAANESVYFGLSARDSLDHRALITHEVLAVLGSVPEPPLGIAASPTPTGVALTWAPNAEADLLGYHVYRSTTSGSGYVALTGSPVTDPLFDDASVAPHTRYYYVVTAVDSSLNESGFSLETSGQLVTLDAGILLVDETRDGTNAWFPTDAVSDSVYALMMAPMPHDIWDWDTDGPPDVSALVSYSTVLWVADDHNRVLTGNLVKSQFLREAEPTLSAYLDLGGNVMLVGWEPARGTHVPLEPPFVFGAGEFLHDYFGVEQIDRVAPAFWTEGVGEGPFPSLSLEASRLRPIWNGNMIRVEYATALRSGTTVDYRFGSADPDSAYHLEPCGWHRDNGTSRTVLWTFPLFHLNNADATQALAAAMAFLGEPTTGSPIGDRIPGRFSLGRGRPNPFRGETRIGFSIPDDGAQVRLTIHDVAGRRVRSLVPGEWIRGQHVVTWDGRNDEGRPTAAGIYFYRLRAETSNRTVDRTRKIVLLR